MNNNGKKLGRGIKALIKTEKEKLELTLPQDSKTMQDESLDVPVFGSMSIKEIAKLTGKAPRTIKRWCNKASVKMTDISVKMVHAVEHKNPAQFNLKEVIEIIRAGGNDSLATLLITNIRYLMEQAVGKDDSKFIDAIQQLREDIKQRFIPPSYHIQSEDGTTSVAFPIRKVKASLPDPRNQNAIYFEKLTRVIEESKIVKKAKKAVLDSVVDIYYKIYSENLYVKAGKEKKDIMDYLKSNSDIVRINFILEDLIRNNAL